MRDGYRESTESWAELLRDLRAHGLEAPVLAVGDGALGFWGALRDVFPQTREQRCWVHKTVNVLDALPKRLQEAAKAALHAVYEADGRESALDAVRAFAEAFADYPKATRKVTDDLEALLTFYDFPREHMGAPTHDQPNKCAITGAALPPVMAGFASEAFFVHLYTGLTLRSSALTQGTSPHRGEVGAGAV